MLTTLTDKLDPRHAALITIDVQNDFCNPEAFPAKSQGRDVSMHMQMIDGIVELVERARLAGVPVIHMQNIEAPWTMSEPMKELRLKQKARRAAGKLNNDYPLCAPGSFGAEFFRITVEPQDIVIVKHRYSAFIGTQLDVVLRSTGRRSLIFCGGGTNLCLESSVRDAFMLDYYCVVVADCSPTPWGLEAYRASLENIEVAFGQVVNLRDVAAVWTKHAKKEHPNADLAIP
jgi:ureidoacrylate peracid hydrolase